MLSFLKQLAADPAATIELKKSDFNGLGGAPDQISNATVSGALNTVYLIAGIVAVLVIIIGGIRYTTSNGDSSQIQAAKNMITYAVVGIVVIIAAATITQFVIQNVTK